MNTDYRGNAQTTEKRRYGKAERKKVERYFTTDGVEHKTKAAADKHQRTLNLQTFVDSHGYNGMDKEGIASMIELNAEELKALLG